MASFCETQIYTLRYIAGNAPYASADIFVPFEIKKILFKPVNCYFTAEQAANGSEFNPFLVYTDMMGGPRAIGYSGHIANALPGVAGAAGQWIACQNDVTFKLISPLRMQSARINFWLGASLNSGNTFATCPFTGVITLMVEYHG